MKRTTYKLPKFFLEVKTPGHPASIFLKYSFAPGQRISIYTGQRIAPDKWNPDQQRVKRNVTGAREINDILDAYHETALKAVRESRLNNTTLTTEELKVILKSRFSDQEEPKGFFDYWDQFVENESKLKDWSVRTIQKFNTIKSQLKHFEGTKQKKNKSFRIHLHQVNDVFFEEVIDFLRIAYDLRNITTQHYIKRIQWFLNWCIKKNLLPAGFRHSSIELKQAQKKVIYLDMDEIKHIYSMDIPASKNYLKRTRDIFIFQCLTGLRFSDIYNLKAADISGGSILVNTIKTGEAVDIELNDTTRAILDKYQDHQKATGQAFPVVQNAVYNRYLKELARMAGLDEKITLVHYMGSERKEETFEKWQLITTHTARRSFITNGLALGIGSEVIRSWTGHRSEASFKAYYEIVKARKRIDMDKYTI